jgi:hypothetical protein
LQILSGDTRSNGHWTASAPMEVELRNESEMPANFNWNIPVNMEACHLVRRCEKVDLPSVAAEVACKIQLRHKFRQQTRPEAEVWNAKFSQCRQDVDGAGGVAWIGLASYHLCYALPLPGTYSAQRKAAMHGDCGAIQSGGRRRSAACCFLIAFSCSASVFSASHILS